MAEASDPQTVVGNERLTSLVGAVLFVLFALEGLTILWGVGSTRRIHIFIGMLLLPPVLLKVGSTMYRAARYYLGDPTFVDRGPPPWLLRLAGPFVVLTSIAVLGTGIVLVAVRPRPQWANLGHKASFILWFGAMTLHVLGHIRDTPALASADFRPSAPAARGRGTRLAAVAVSLLLGLGLGTWSLSWHGGGDGRGGRKPGAHGEGRAIRPVVPAANVVGGDGGPP